MIKEFILSASRRVGRAVRAAGDFMDQGLASQAPGEPRVARRDSGSAMIEAAITLPVFLLILSGAISLATISYRSVGLYYTVIATTRWAVLGKTLPGQSRVNSIKSKAREIGQLYGLKLPTTNIFVCNVGATSCSPENAGVPEGYIQISATEPAPVFLGLFSLNLAYSALGRNEPFS